MRNAMDALYTARACGTDCTWRRRRRGLRSDGRMCQLCPTALPADRLRHPSVARARAPQVAALATSALMRKWLHLLRHRCARQRALRSLQGGVLSGAILGRVRRSVQLRAFSAWGMVMLCERLSRKVLRGATIYWARLCFDRSARVAPTAGPHRRPPPPAPTARTHRPHPPPAPRSSSRSLVPTTPRSCSHPLGLCNTCWPSFIAPWRARLPCDCTNLRPPRRLWRWRVAGRFGRRALAASRSKALHAVLRALKANVASCRLLASGLAALGYASRRRTRAAGVCHQPGHQRHQSCAARVARGGHGHRDAS